MNEIIPAVLAKNVSDLTEKVSALPPEINLFHFDVLEEDVWADVDRDFEVHLMVKEPEKIISRWVERGANRIILHSLGGTTAKLEDAEIGLAVELHIPLEEIFPLIPEINFLNLMSIAQIGAQGHLFDERIFDRIKQVKAKFPQMPISVDGGVNTANYRALREAGADRLVVGSGFKDLWKSLTKN